MILCCFKDKPHARYIFLNIPVSEVDAPSFAQSQDHARPIQNHQIIWTKLITIIHQFQGSLFGHVGRSNINQFNHSYSWKILPKNPWDVMGYQNHLFWGPRGVIRRVWWFKRRGPVRAVSKMAASLTFHLPTSDSCHSHSQSSLGRKDGDPAAVNMGVPYTYSYVTGPKGLTSGYAPGYECVCRGVSRNTVTL